MLFIAILESSWDFELKSIIKKCCSACSLIATALKSAGRSKKKRSLATWCSFYPKSDMRIRLVRQNYRLYKNFIKLAASILDIANCKQFSSSWKSASNAQQPFLMIDFNLKSREHSKNAIKEHILGLYGG